VDSVIVGKLGYGNHLYQLSWMLVHKELKKLFDFLIDSLGLTTGLGW